MTVRNLTQAEKTTLEAIVFEAIQEGSYYGNREQYYARLQRLLKWVESVPTKSA